MTAATSRLVALTGLVILATLLGAARGPATVIFIAPLAALLIAGAVAASRWAIATAIVMLPYFSYGVMEILTNPDGRLQAVAFSVLSIVVFLAALDSMRRH
ncbi:MAG: DUF2069 domain-containing protein [Gammaproteobacteria bacterium]|nr:MAG: DUF2069 domain-containing protein [Gammaproteobacteria bacterium]